MAYTTGTIEGTYPLYDGSPSRGKVEIIPNSKILVDAEGNKILSGRIKADLDENGSFSVEVPATDDATVEPAIGRQYTVVAKLAHTTLAPVTITVGTDETVNMADVTSAAATAAELSVWLTAEEYAALVARVGDLEAAPGGVSSVNGEAGDVSLSAADVGALDETTAAATFAVQGDLQAEAVRLLNIPTPDGNPSVTHLSVAYRQQKWNGYRYWMGYTPYPDETRENPAIAASNDGVNWEVPPGASNVVAPLSEAAANGYSFQSDPCVLFVDDELWMYYRPASYTPNKEAVYLKRSSDGVTWTAGVKVAENTSSVSTLLSPAVVQEANGTFTMWCNDATQAQTARLRRRTSADGLTWSAPSGCTLPGDVMTMWHLDVQRVADRYFLLMASDPSSSPRLYFMESADGITWTGNNTDAIPISGFSYDTRGYYKSCLMPRPGTPVSFDAYLACIDSTGATVNQAVHRAVRHENVNLRAGHPLKVHDRIWVSGADMYPTSGSPAVTVISSRTPVLAFDGASTAEAAACIVKLPSSWNKARVVLHTANLGAGTGDVKWQVARSRVQDTQLLPNADQNAEPKTVTALAQNINQWIYFTEFDITGRSYYVFRINRNPADAADTLGNDAGIIGLSVERMA